MIDHILVGKMLRSCFSFTVIFLLMFNGSSVKAQSQDKVYSLLLLNFAKGIQWPSHAANGTFVIGVLAYPPLVAELNKAIATTKLGVSKVEVREYSSVEDLNDCQILFIPAFKAKQFGSVLDKVGSDPTLIVTNKTEFAKKGAGVNFVFLDGKLKYEINCKAIEKRGMKISASLKGMGIIVE